MHAHACAIGSARRAPTDDAGCVRVGGSRWVGRSQRRRRGTARRCSEYSIQSWREGAARRYSIRSRTGRRSVRALRSPRRSSDPSPLSHPRTHARTHTHTHTRALPNPPTALSPVHPAHTRERSLLYHGAWRVHAGLSHSLHNKWATVQRGHHRRSAKARGSKAMRRTVAQSALFRTVSGRRSTGGFLSGGALAGFYCAEHAGLLPRGTLAGL